MDFTVSIFFLGWSFLEKVLFKLLEDFISFSFSFVLSKNDYFFESFDILKLKVIKLAFFGVDSSIIFFSPKST
jgi:hypothetical protein